ncbi:MAG: class I SAM-dependent methyltransferase [candidate division KSB1 bacterium]
MPWLSLQKNVEATPYSRLAEFYDHLMGHVNYRRWADYIIAQFDLATFPEPEPFVTRNARPPHAKVATVLELACGTGKVLVELSRSGFETFGLDLSPAMAHYAARRLRQEGFRAQVWCADMQHVATGVQMDAVICLYDSMNYCRHPHELTRVFESMAQVVRPGGLFIFDVCTRWNCWKNFRNYVEHDSFRNFSYHRHSYFHPIGNLQYNEFLIVDERDPGPTLREKHVQRIYSLNEIRKLAASGLWEEAACLSGMSQRPGSERAERVHFVFRRK